jgi:hypothetical protein
VFGKFHDVVSFSYVYVAFMTHGDFKNDDDNSSLPIIKTKKSRGKRCKNTKKNSLKKSSKRGRKTQNKFFLTKKNLPKKSFGFLLC